MIIINYKAYTQATGKAAEELTKKVENARKKTDNEIIVAPSTADLNRLETENMYSQHIDPFNPGSHTGHTTVETAKEAGATGTLLNHSERRLEKNILEHSVAIANEKGLTTVVCAQDPEECGEVADFNPDYIAYEPPELIGGETSVSSAKPELIKQAVEEAGATGTLLNHSERRLEKNILEHSVAIANEKGLTTVVCAQDPEECGEIADFNPDYIAYEPPELIGGETSVSSAKPELIKQAVEEAGETPLLTGAGIKNQEDVEKSIELGCKGVLVASGVIKSEKPFEEIMQLCEGL